jgi:hypothetical protein
MISVTACPSRQAHMLGVSGQISYTFCLTVPNLSRCCPLALWHVEEGPDMLATKARWLFRG